MATGQRKDPFSAFNFQVQIDGVTVAGFSECSGLVAETEIIDYRNGDEDITRRRLPGLKKFNNIVLKRGFTNSKELWTWRKTVMDGKTQRQAGVDSAARRGPPARAAVELLGRVGGQAGRADAERGNQRECNRNAGNRSRGPGDGRLGRAAGITRLRGGGHVHVRDAWRLLRAGR